MLPSIYGSLEAELGNHSLDTKKQHKKLDELIKELQEIPKNVTIILSHFIK